MEGAKPPINEEDRMTMKKIQKDRSDLDKAVETGNPFYGMEGNEGYVEEEPQQKDAVLDFIKNKNPDVLIFVSMDRGGDLKNDDTKTKLYKYALAKNIPSGYKLETDLKLFDGYDLEGMILYKANLWEVRFEKRFTALKNG
jgi:hypothetical protein